MNASRILRASIATLMILLTHMGLAQQNAYETSCKDLSEIVKMEQHAYAKHHQFRSNPLTANYDIKYHRLEWSVDPAQNYIAGTVTTYFIPVQEDVSRINFDLSENMQVNAVTYRGDTVSYAFTATDNLEIELPVNLDMHVLDSVSVHYEGAPQSLGFGSFRQGSHGGVPVLWTLSEPYGAKSWWPCKQELSDKIDSIDVIVRTPDQYRVASNGLLVSEVADAGDKTYHWRHRYPIPAYLIAIGVTNYEVFSDFVELTNGDTLEVLNYIYPEDRAKAEVDLEGTIEIMTFFDSLFGDYPFADEKYGHAQFGFSGGMEHQTMSFMGKFTYDLQAHELAHQWFGDKVTCGSWQDIWLNEGFATYLTGLTKEFLGTEQQFYNWKRDRVNHITGHTAGSVWVDDTTSVLRIFSSRLSYSKGSMLLHMLRWVMGDEPFFQAIRNYINAPELAYGYARTEDLKFYLEQASGLDLTEFFDDWLYGQGYPRYHLNWSDAGGRIQFTLHQSTSDASVDFFEMPVPVYLAGEGRDTIVRLEHTFDGQMFEVELPFVVETVEIDPDYWLISKNNTVEYLPVSTREIRQLAEALRLDPNPFSNEIIVELSDPSLDINQILVNNSNGTLFGQYKISEQRTHLDTHQWPAGIYLISVQASNGASVTRKVVKP